jgi:hypothetical protein
MRISAPPVMSAACHCTGCQKLTSGAYSLSLMLPAQGFEVLEGATEIGALHKPDAQHHYCPHCKSWLYTPHRRLVHGRQNPNRPDDHPHNAAGAD